MCDLRHVSCDVLRVTSPSIQAYLVLLDPQPFSGIPYFKLVMFSSVLVVAVALLALYERFEKHLQQQQHYSLKDPLLGSG